MLEYIGANILNTDHWIYWCFVLVVWWVLLDRTCGAVIEEWVQQYTSHKLGWFKVRKAQTELPANIDKLLKKLGKKRGYKRKVREAIKTIELATNTEKGEV